MKQKKNVEGDEEEPKRLEETWGEREANVFSCVGTKKKISFLSQKIIFFFSCFAPGEMMMVACDRRTCSSLLDRVPLFFFLLSNS